MTYYFIYKSKLNKLRPSCSKASQQPVNHLINYPTSQPTNVPTSQATNQLTIQPVQHPTIQPVKSQLSNLSNNPPIKYISTDQSTNHSTNQPNQSAHKNLPPIKHLTILLVKQANEPAYHPLNQSNNEPIKYPTRYTTNLTTRQPTC